MGEVTMMKDTVYIDYEPSYYRVDSSDIFFGFVLSGLIFISLLAY
jgi:hypothetical protein